MMTQPATGRAARLEDVAALAGVSTATASKALHNKPRISEETKQRVLDAAKQLNYSPNKLAQSLARGTTGTIGLVTSDLQGRFSTPILIARRTSCEPNRPQYCWPTLMATPPWNVSMSRNCCPSRSTDCSSCSARPTPGPRLAMTGACHWSTSTAPPPTPKTARSLATTWTPVAWPSTISSRVAAGTSPLSAATKLYRCHRPHQGALEALAELGIEPAGPIRYGKWDEGWGRAATRLLLDQGVKFDAVSARTISWPAAALTCSSSRDCASRMTSPSSATITGRY